MKQKIAQKNEQFAEQEQRNKHQPKLAPYQSSQRHRRALQDPKGSAFKANSGKRKTDRHGAQHKAGQREIGKGNHDAQNSGGHRRTVQGQNFEIVQIDDDESEQEKKLRPLRGVAQERLDVLDHDRADVPGEHLRNSVQQSIGPEKIASTLSRF